MTQHTHGVGTSLRLHGLLATTCAIGSTFSLAAAVAPAAAAGSAKGYRATVMRTPHLVSYWRGGELATSNHAVDSKGSNRGIYRAGTDHRAAGLLRSSRNKAVAYNGWYDRLRVADDNSLDFRSAFTLEAWVKPQRLRKRATIMRKDFAYFLRADKNDLRVAFWDKEGRMRRATAKNRLVEGRRHHVVATYARHTLKLYVNSRLVKRKELAAGTRLRRTGNRLTIGRSRLQPFFGLIDEPAVYRAALTSKQIARHHAVGMRKRRGAPQTAPNAAPAPAPAPPAPAAAPAPPERVPSGSVLWNGDFETGDLRQYQAVQGVAPDRITLSGSPSRKGRFATKLTAFDTDTEITENPRAQLMSAAQHFPGQDQFIGWSTLFPADFPAIQGAGAFFVFFQFHGKPYSGSPPLGWSVAPDGRIELARNQQYGYDRVWSMPLVKARWVSFVAHVKWSKDQSEGFVELWVDGVPQRFSNGQLRLYTQTVMDDQNDGLKTIPTNYRRKGIVPGSVTIYQDEVKLGTTYDAVAP